jgi:Bacterial HORMA domain 2
MTTRTTTTTTTRTHTATWLSDVILGTIADILADLGIDLTRLYRDWDQDEAAIKAWILEQSLSVVLLECHQPNGTVSPVVEFPVKYRAGGDGDAQFTAHRASLARFRAKIDRVPAGTTYRLFCLFSRPHSTQPGWEPGNRASTTGLRSMSVGTIATAPDASASMRYLR